MFPAALFYSQSDVKVRPGKSPLIVTVCFLCLKIKSQLLFPFVSALYQTKVLLCLLLTLDFTFVAAFHSIEQVQPHNLMVS